MPKKVECSVCGHKELRVFNPLGKSEEDRVTGWCAVCGSLTVRGEATPCGAWSALRTHGYDLSIDGEEPGEGA